MKLTHEASPILDPESTASGEALRQIIEVFRDGHRAAAHLRVTAMSLTPSQLEDELEAIEDRMLSQISLICDTYHVQPPHAPRN